MDNDINREINIEQVEFGIDIDNIEYSIEINPRDTFAIELNEQGPQGARGYTGNGIESYVKTSTAGLIDTYTITFTDGNTTTVDVTNGRGITSITGPVSVGNVDTYTINYNDSTTSTFTVTNGIDGVNPTITVGSTTTGNPGTSASVTNVGTTQDVILDFTIPRGDKGDTGTAATIAVGTVTTGLPTDPASVTNVGTSGAAVFDFTIPKGDTGSTGATGNGIASITKTGTVGLVDTYTILYTDGTSTTFTVTNGQNGMGSVADVLVNGTSVLDGQDAKILIKTINSNSITGSGNLNVGTVTSVNNVAPISGDVTLTANDVDALPDSTKYGADLSYSSNTLQLLDQAGNSLGSPVTIQSSPDIDNKSITTNLSDELQTVGVIDSNNTTNAIKTWTGTKAQYEAIATKDANTLYFCTDSGEIYLGSVLISNKTNGKDVGDVVFSLTPKTDAGLHLLDGALIQGSGIYSAFVTYIAGLVSTYPNLFVTESAWQTAVTTYGVCGKFVYDSTNNTVRLPKITGIIEGTTDLTALGDLVEAGLPNITGSLNFYSGDGYSQSGAITYTKNSGSNNPGGGNMLGNCTLGFDASRSSSIYRNDVTTVQPQTIKVLYYIVIATSTKTDIQVDIDEVTTDLNGKVNTSDLAEVQCVIETYSNGTSWYRVYSDGWCVQGGYANAGVTSVNLLKAYKDTNYNIQISSTYNGNTYSSNPTTRTKTSFNFVYNGSATQMWQASGYIV